MSTFEEKVNDYLSNHKTGILGVVALAVPSTGKDIYSFSSGRASLQISSPPSSPDTSIFRLASCSKLITAIAVLRLIQTQNLVLDDPGVIKEHLPELWVVDSVFTSSPNEPPTFEKRNKGITLRMLLTHSSGVGYDTISPLLQSYRKARSERSLALSGPIAEAFSTPLLFQPGEGWAYGGGLDWTGLLISRVSGMTFGQFLRKEVFDIIGLDHRIGFLEDIEESGRSGDVVPVFQRGKGGQGWKEMRIGRQRAQMGGGGTFSSARNFFKIMADVTSEKGRLLEKKWADMLFQPQFEEGSKALEMLREDAGVFTSMTGALMGTLSRESLNHGLGGMLVMEDNPDLGKTKGTMAWGGAFNSIWFANRETGVAGFLGTSLFPPGDAKCSELTGEFIKEVWSRMDK